MRAGLLSCFFLPRGVAVVGPEQLGSLVSVGMVLSPCLFQGGAQDISSPLRKFESFGSAVREDEQPRPVTGWAGWGMGGDWYS